MATNKLNLPHRRQSSFQSAIENRPSISWNRRTEVFKVSESGSIQLGPEEDEIEKIYGQIHHLMETLNEKFGLTVKKKEDNCLVAFKKVMKSIEKDLCDIKQQVEESKKVTRDSDEGQTLTNLQKQLNFFRDESLSLTRKLKVSEKAVKELARRNKQLEAELEQEHRMLVRSEKERKALKSATTQLSSTGNGDVFPEISDNSSPISGRRAPNLGNEWHENRELSEIKSTSLLEIGSISDRKTRSVSCKNAESRYKKDSLQINSLKEQLDQILKKKAGFLNSDKLEEIVSIVTGVVSRRLQAQENQIGALNTKMFKLKQYYQYLLRTQSGTDLPFGLDEILFVFWDIFTVFKLKDKGDTLGKISARGTERELNRQNMLNYRHSLEPNKPDRNAVLDSIRNGNKRFSQINKEEKTKIMQMLLDDPVVDGLLDHYAQAMKFQRKADTTLVQQLAKIKATGSYPQTPVASDLLASDDEEGGKTVPEPIFKEDFFFARARNQQIAASQGVNSMLSTSQTHAKSLSLITKYQSPDFAEGTAPVHSFGDQEGPEMRKDTSSTWVNGRFLDVKNPFDKEEVASKVEVSFSTPRGFTKEATEEELLGREIRMPLGEEKEKKDFRRKFLVKNGKVNGNV